MAKASKGGEGDGKRRRERESGGRERRLSSLL